MKVHFINVGQGDEVVAYLKKMKVDVIDIMSATHPDADHLVGLNEVLKAFKVKSVYAPKVAHTTDAYKNFLNAVKAGVKLPLKTGTAKFVGPTRDYGKTA